MCLINCERATYNTAERESHLLSKYVFAKNQSRVRNIPREIPVCTQFCPFKMKKAPTTPKPTVNITTKSIQTDNRVSDTNINQGTFAPVITDKTCNVDKHNTT